MARTNTLGNFLTDVADAIRTKKGSSDTILASDFDTEIENLPSGGGATEAKEKDVNFYDHTGFRHYSYTKSEFLALESMPANPEISGLTAQGWNFTLAKAKEYVNYYGGLVIGQSYITNDGKTRVYIELDEGRLNPYLSVSVNGTAVIEWGDGTSNTITGTSTYQNQKITTQHIYASGGKYVISISVTGEMAIVGQGYYSNMLLWNNQANQQKLNRYYNRCIKKVEIGSNIILGYGALSFSELLESVSIPVGITTIGYEGFKQCRSLKIIILPSGVTSLDSEALSQLSNTKYISLPDSLVTFSSSPLVNVGLTKIYFSLAQTISDSQYQFSSLLNISYLKMPNKLTSLNRDNFLYCDGLKFIDMSEYTQIPSITGTPAFNNTPDDCKIIVPDDLYEDWIGTNNWSNIASRIIKKSDYDAL